MELQSLFYPVVGVSNHLDPTYFEYSPSDDLKSYIRCFWGHQRANGEEQPKKTGLNLVIPDACSDILFQYYEEDQSFTAFFYKMDERATLLPDPLRVATMQFGIRFYGWAASAFMDDSMKEVSGEGNLVEWYFPGLTKKVEQAFYEKASVGQLILLAEEYLRQHYREQHVSPRVWSAVGDMILTYGGSSIEEIATRNLISKRQLERGFLEYLGMSPKKMAGVIRYQLIWQDLIYGRRRNMSEMLEKYQYADQAHLLNDFKKHHGMSWKDALDFYRKSLEE